MPNLLLSRRAKLLCCSTLLAASQWSLAGGPDVASAPVNPLTGFEIGIQGLVGVGITNTREQFNASNTVAGIPPAITTYSMGNAILTANAITAGGGSIGYNIPWGNTFAVEPLFGFNAFYGKIKSQGVIYGARGGDPLGTQNTVTLKNQYNLLVNLKKLISSNVALTLGLGASYMQFDNNLAVIPFVSGLNAVPNNRNNNGVHGIGPIIGVGAQWLLGHHSSVAVNFDNYMYIEKNLGTMQNIDPENWNNYSTLKNRKITLFLPVLSMQYNINFCI